MTTKLKDSIRAELEKAKAVAADAESESRDLTGEERSTIKAHVDEAANLKERLRKADADSDLLAELAGLGEGIDEDRIKAEVAPGTLGERFVKDAGLAAYLKSVAPTGDVPKSARIHSPAVAYRGFKDVFAGSDADRGAPLIPTDQRGLLDAGVFRELRIRDLVSIGSTTSDTVSYARYLTSTNAADTVPEATGTSLDGTGGDAGIKPESDLQYEEVTEPVKTIAHWLPATKRALSDAAQVQSLIDNFLRQGLAEVLEDQMVSGGGTGEDFTGILNASGIQAQLFDTDLVISIRKAITKVRPFAGGNIVVALNPAEDEAIDLMTDGNGAYIFGGPVRNGASTVWGRPRVVSDAIPAGTMLVGGFQWASLWDREAAAVQASDSHADFFTRNLVAILAELRAAFGVVRPAAFCSVATSA